MNYKYIKILLSNAVHNLINVPVKHRLISSDTKISKTIYPTKISHMLFLTDSKDVN